MNHNLPGNPHAAKADGFHTDSDTQATLALAHEVRTQTLAYIAGSSNPAWLLNDNEFEQLRTDIRTRLGLNGDQK